MHVANLNTVVAKLCTQKEITSQTNKYLVILSSKPHVFEEKMTKYKSVWLIISFSV